MRSPFALSAGEPSRRRWRQGRATLRDQNNLRHPHDAYHYPALRFQTRQFLKFEPAGRIAAPSVKDVFLLDAMTKCSAYTTFLNYIDRLLTLITSK